MLSSTTEVEILVSLSTMSVGWAKACDVAKFESLRAKVTD
jgi:hypothetical protein